MLWAVLLLAMASVGCTNDMRGMPGGEDSCTSRCEQGKEEGCYADSLDCEMRCMDARTSAEADGCTAELEAALACEETLDICQSGCLEEVNALMQCHAGP